MCSGSSLLWRKRSTALASTQCLVQQAWLSITGKSEGRGFRTASSCPVSVRGSQAGWQARRCTRCDKSLLCSWMQEAGMQGTEVHLSEHFHRVNALISHTAQAHALCHRYFCIESADFRTWLCQAGTTWCSLGHRYHTVFKIHSHKHAKP